MMDKMATAALDVARHREAHQRVDKAVDWFYLAVQLTSRRHPDLRVW